MKKRTSPQNKRTAIIRIRATETEAREIIDGADLSNLSLSEFCRRRIFNRKITAQTDIKTIAELRKIGGLLKKVFSDRHGSEDTKNILTEVRRAITRIANPAEA